MFLRIAFSLLSRINDIFASKIRAKFCLHFEYFFLHFVDCIFEAHCIFPPAYFVVAPGLVWLNLAWANKMGEVEVLFWGGMVHDMSSPYVVTVRTAWRVSHNAFGLSPMIFCPFCGGQYLPDLPVCALFPRTNRRPLVDRNRCSTRL